MALAVTTLVSCEPKDNTETVFKYPEYAYIVDISANPKPTGFVAVEITYLDLDGNTITKKVTESWKYTVPAKKGFKMEMTSKMVLAGTERPTSGSVDYSITTGICGIKDNSKDLLIAEMHKQKSTTIRVFLAEIDDPSVKEYKYEIQPILEPGM